MCNRALDIMSASNLYAIENFHTFPTLMWLGQLEKILTR